MSRNPFYNAILAIAYIVCLVSLASILPTIFSGQKDNIFMPMAAISILVLSVSLMAYLFFYEPVVMFIDGEREKAVKLFLQTVGIFAVGATIIFIISLALSVMGR